jgi:exosortase/archaeosortase family protein
MLVRPTVLISGEVGSSERFFKSHALVIFWPPFFFLLLQSLPFLWPEMKQTFFCFPASWLAALLLGAERGQDAAGYPILTMASVALRVGESCSGYDFFCLCTGLLLWIQLRARRVLCFLALMLGIGITLSVAMGTTLLANVSRLCCVAWLSPLAGLLFPDRWHGLFHYCLGVFVFLPYLLLLSLVSERICHVFRYRAH